MQIKDAQQATVEARRILGNPVCFEPLRAKKVGRRWLVKARLGVLDRVIVSMYIPAKLIEVDHA